MECGICLEENILEKDMHYTECLHLLCFKCYKKLRTNKCPFCRSEIYIIYNISISFIKRDRQEFKRNKKQRKLQKLNNILNENKNNPNILPNLRKRNNKKISFL